MADRVLPSRDIATQINKAFDVRGLAADRAGQAMQIVEAYAEGRLVDRKAIDYEAAGRKHVELWDNRLLTDEEAGRAILDVALSDVDV